MMPNFAESGLRASSALERGELKSKGKGVKTEDITPDSPAQDPSLSTSSQPGYP